LIQRKFGKIRAVFPFNAEKKYSAIALENPENSESVSIYIKGAPE
jgi:magnesium-transporting ATPase (P-type)